MENINAMPLVVWPSLSEDVRSAIVLELGLYRSGSIFGSSNPGRVEPVDARAGMTNALRTELNLPLIRPYILFSCHVPEMHLYARRLRNAQNPHTRWEP